MVLRRWLGALTVFIFILVFATLILAARMLGGFLPPPAIATLSLAQCEPQPCWNGIQLGQTELDQAEAVLKADPRFPVVYSDSATSVRWTGASIPAWRDGRIFAEQPGRPNRVSLVNYLPTRGALRLGDAFAAFGRPMGACEEGGGLWRDILFEGGISVVLGPMRGDNPERLHPEMIVRWVTFGERAERSREMPWRGLTRPGVHQRCD